MGPKKKSAGTEPPAKRRRTAQNGNATNILSASDTTNSDIIQSLTKNITSNIMAELQKVGVLPTQNPQVEQAGGPDQDKQQRFERNTSGTMLQGEQIPASAVLDLERQLPNTQGNQSEYKPLGRPLHTYVTTKLKEKILSNEFVQMSDILDPPTELEFVDFHLSVKDKGKVGLSSNKKKKFVTIEEWTDAFNIFSSVLRQGSPDDRDLPESLSVYMHLIRSIQKDGGDWFHYDVTFRKARQGDLTMSWRHVDQVLYSRALMKKLGGPIIHSQNTKNQLFRPHCFRYNDGKSCNSQCKYPHICSTCFKPHPKTQCWRGRDKKSASGSQPPKKD